MTIEDPIFDVEDETKSEQWNRLDYGMAWPIMGQVMARHGDYYLCGAW
jgi:hypothetical protein